MGPPNFKLINLTRYTHEIFRIGKYEEKITFDKIWGYHNEEILSNKITKTQTWTTHARPGFLTKWPIGDFAVGHRAIPKIGCFVQKSLISVISIIELTIGNSDALTFFSEIKAKIALPVVKTCFFFRRSGQKSLFQRRRPFFGGGGVREITRQTTLTRKWRLFSRWRALDVWSNSGGPQINGRCKLSRNKKWVTVPKRLRTTALD